MKQLYIVAQNAFAVSVADGLKAWTEIMPRYSPFVAKATTEPVLEVDIQVGEIPVRNGSTIYETVDDGIGFVSASVSRRADGSLVMEFKHVAEPRTRLWMRMPAVLNKADIVIAPDGDGDDPYFLTHAVMIAYMLATGVNGTLLIHSAAVVEGGKAYLFQGKSGTGKSTHAALWMRNIAGAELLNDDHPVIRFAPDGVAMAYGSPWSGKTDCYRNLSAPVGAFVRIVRGKENVLEILQPLKAYASLTASVFYLPFLSEEVRETRHRVIERLVESVQCCEMHCRPDREAALTCHHSLGQ